MSLLCAVAVGLAVLLVRPPERWHTRSRLGLPVTVPGRPAAGAVTIVLVALVALGGPVLLGLPGPRVVLALTVVAAGSFALRQARSARRRAAVGRRRLEVADLVGLMSAELRAGVLPQRVVTGLATDFPFLAPAARAAELGGDIPAALRVAADVPGRAPLREVAGAWQVAERSGAPLARVLDRLEETSRSDRDVAREVESGLAPARATGRLMAVLPVVGLALGSGMGGDPLAVLTGTWPGVLCFALGVALACTGIVWVERIAVTVEQEL